MNTVQTNVTGSESFVWPLIGTQSSGGVLHGSREGEFGEELEHKCLFADSKLLRLEAFFFLFFFHFPSQLLEPVRASGLV